MNNILIAVSIEAAARLAFPGVTEKTTRVFSKVHTLEIPLSLKIPHTHAYHDRVIVGYEIITLVNQWEGNGFRFNWGYGHHKDILVVYEKTNSDGVGGNR